MVNPDQSCQYFRPLQISLLLLFWDVQHPADYMTGNRTREEEPIETLRNRYVSIAWDIRCPCGHPMFPILAEDVIVYCDGCNWRLHPRNQVRKQGDLKRALFCLPRRLLHHIALRHANAGLRRDT